MRRPRIAPITKRIDDPRRLQMIGAMRIKLVCMTLLIASIAHAGELNAIAIEAAQTAFEKFNDRKLQKSEIAITVIDLRDPNHTRAGSFRGDERFYPASVVKLFYLVASEQWLEDGKLAPSESLTKDLRDMIVVSSNQATARILDAVTDTQSGPELAPDEFKTWSEKRNAINRYFASKGYYNINANQKTWAEQKPSPRDNQFLGEKLTNRNALTTNATARLLSEIVLGKAVTPDRSAQMMKLLERNNRAATKNADDQATGFSAKALATEDKLWSKAGWTSTARHDAAYIETADGLKVVIVTFTFNHANERQIIPTVVSTVLEQFRKAK